MPFTLWLYLKCPILFLDILEPNYMRNLLLISFLIFQCPSLFAQFSIPGKEVDSIFKSMHISKNDWALALTVVAPGRIYDSLGNPVGDVPDGEFLLLNINREYFLQKLYVDYETPFNVKVKVSSPIKLDKEIDFQYTPDSIMLASQEIIYPCVYRNKRENTYGVPQGSHDPFYGMYFKTVKESGFYRDFRRMDVTKKVFYSNVTNLNYRYNSSTFIYRSFNRIYQLATKKMKAFSSN